jgi:uncharacterized membrane protein
VIDRSFLYDLLLFLHIFAAIVGFGTVFFNGLYGAQAKQRPGPGGVAIGEANFAVTMVAEWFIYSVPITGILLVLAQGNLEIWKFSQLWVWLSIVLYVVALGISHGNQIPSSKRMNALSKELAAAGPPPEGAQGGPPPQVVEMEALGKRLETGGMALTLLLVVILGLMVWKPGV